MIENNITAVKDICFLIFNILARFDLMVCIKTYGFVSYYAECSPTLIIFVLQRKTEWEWLAQNYPKRYFHFHMALATNGVVDAIKYVQGKMNHLNKIEKQKYKMSMRDCRLNAD